MQKPNTELNYDIQNLHSHDFQNIRLDGHMFGVGTGRFNALLQLNEQQILIPAGLTLCVYNLQTFVREKVLQYNNDAIFVLIENKNYIFSIGFSGEVIIIEKKTLKQVNKLQSQGREVRFASVNEKYLCLSCEIMKEQKLGSLEVFQIEDLSNISQDLIMEGRYRYSILGSSDSVISMVENPIGYEDSLNNNIPSQENNQHQKANHYLVKIDLKLKKETNKVHYPYVGDIIYAGSENEFACYMYSDRRLLIIDLEKGNEQPLYFGKIEGSGGILSCTLQDRHLYFCPQNNKLVKIKLSEKIKDYLPELITINQAHNQSEFQVIELKSIAICNRNFFMRWNKLDEEFFVFNEEGLILYSFKNKKQIAQIQHANITCVGLAAHPQNGLVSVGDMVGNIYIYDTNNKIDGNIHKQVWVMGTIRCLAWSPCGKYIYAGCMDGSVYRWEYENNNSEPSLVVSLESTVTSIKPKLKKNQEIQYLVTLTSGKVCIFYDFSKEKTDYLIREFLAHKPVPQHLNPNPGRFGSLHLHAEVWNSTWDCNEGNQIATCSEDQSGHIFDISQKNQNLVHVLDGQHLAVTSVDWQKMDPSIGELYAQCSDDRTVRFYNPNNDFKLLFEISTTFIHEWHTLTYLALEKNGTKIAIGGQSGFLFIFDIKQQKWVYAEKIHLGGIEGLIWENSQIITCSSDCCVNIIRYS